MKIIEKVIRVQKKRKNGHLFYVSTILLDDQEIYTVAHWRPAQPGDEVQAWFDEKWGKPKARYPA